MSAYITKELNVYSYIIGSKQFVFMFLWDYIARKPICCVTSQSQKNCVICILYNECNNDEFETHATYDVNNISLENITEFHTKYHSPYKMLVNLDVYKVKYA